MYVRPKKHLGQHFLTDLSVARRIAGSLKADRCRSVFEVGCGTGVLTQFLLQRDDITLYGAEVDRESVAYLHENYPQFSDRLIEGDFLKMDLEQHFPKGVNIIGNFPYNISSQIFFRILAYRDRVPEVVGMVQREVAVRIAEKPGTKDYGILGVIFDDFIPHLPILVGFRVARHYLEVRDILSDKTRGRRNLHAALTVEVVEVVRCLLSIAKDYRASFNFYNALYVIPVPSGLEPQPVALAQKFVGVFHIFIHFQNNSSCTPSVFFARPEGGQPRPPKPSGLSTAPPSG